MKIYIYDKNTKIFLAETVAQKNPKRQGEFLFPKNSTTLAPPQLNKNQVAIFNGKLWEVSDDFRRELQINLKTKEITTVFRIGKLSGDNILYSEYLKSDEYEKDKLKEKLEEQRESIINEMKSIDAKRIRAVCEPSVKDEKSGLTWLEYYNDKLAELRQKLSEVCDVY